MKTKHWMQGVTGFFGGVAMAILTVCLVLSPPTSSAVEPDQTVSTNGFPTVPEVLGGQTFDTFTERDVYFLRGIHDRYVAYWTALLEANLTVKDYTLSPEKLQRFIDELGEAMRDRNDLPACTNLALITGDISFYANHNVYHAEILQAAARALIKLGPSGRKALASAFSESHYRNDAASLEDLADVIGEAHPTDVVFVQALAATAFDFSTASGAIYPRCTTTAVKNLLGLTNGVAAVRTHFTLEKVLDNPGRFQAVADGVAAGRASELAATLTAIQGKVRERLADHALLPGGYRDDLQELDARMTRALAVGNKVGKGD